MRLVEFGNGHIEQGRILLRRRDGGVLDLAAASEAEMRTVRGADIAMIFQEPMTSLNPSFTVGRQIAEALQLHQGMDAVAARRSEGRRVGKECVSTGRAWWSRDY